MSASIYIHFGRGVPLAEWEAFVEKERGHWVANIFPYNIWKSENDAVELRFGWPEHEEARGRRRPASGQMVHVTSYFERDLPETARLAKAILAALGGEIEALPDALKPHMMESADGPPV